MSEQNPQTITQLKTDLARRVQEELGQNVLVCGASEMIDRLSAYAELGIDEVIASSNFGQDQSETLDMMSRFGEEVLPHVRVAAHQPA